MQSAIVTGANGFVGRAVVNELVLQGVQVYAITRQSDCRIDFFKAIPNVIIIECNMDSYYRLIELIKKADIFYHFAWEGSAGPLRGDDKIQLLNIQHSCDAVKVAAKIGCKKFVFAGSIMEYEVEEVMRTELEPNISTIYASAKKTANFMCRALAGSCGIEYVCGLISNIFGPGEVSPRLINTSICRLLKKEHMSYSSAEQMYDFIYIDDAAKIFVAIGKKGSGNKTYYIGSGKPRKLKDFLIEMRDTVDETVELGIGEISFNGISLNYKEFDIDKVFIETGVEAKVTFTEGIKKTMEWMIKEGV